MNTGCAIALSRRALSDNAHSLARFASICQENGLVPIVEPELTLGPGDYDIEEAAHQTERVLSTVFRKLNSYDVVPEAMLLKPGMVLPGLDAAMVPKEDVAKFTARSMMRTVPPAVPGIHFLSGGMGAEEATSNLQALQRACPNAPWSAGLGRDSIFLMGGSLVRMISEKLGIFEGKK